MDNSLRLESIFFAALEKRSPAERSAFLDEACGKDVELRASVGQMFEAQADAGSFLEQPALVDDATILHEPAISERPGTVIGSYKLLQQLGEGGMGVVFMAEQTEPIQRTVALKIIKPGMDTRQVIARFEAERQALAMMDHPNIARVLDAGTTDSGRPYFVMELVKGVPITRYCDEKHLSLRERLELLLPVCQAVQHAHQKGVIHRDIKPTNVLVAEYDDHAVPKVIDFGVAKATSQKLTEHTMFTEFGQVLGTVEYMSPEQAKLNQLDIDTRSDVYSLGVLLYELLTGSTPFERRRLREAAFDEMLRIIREEEPQKPSTRLSTIDKLPTVASNRHTEPTKLNKDLCGELDWIVMKCLEKDRNRRYATASAFAADIERHLQDEPVEAGPPSAVYRLRKFARRNKVALFVAMATVVTLLSSVVGLAISNRMIAAERDEKVQALAEKELALALSEAQAQITYFKDALQYRRATIGPRETEKMFRSVTKLLDHRDNLSLVPLPPGEVEVRERIGHRQRDLAFMVREVGRLDFAKDAYERSIRTFEKLKEQVPNNVDYWHFAADSHRELGQIAMERKLFVEAEKEFRTAIELHEQRAKHLPPKKEYLREEAAAYYDLARLLIKTGRREEAVPLAARGVEVDSAKYGQPSKVAAQVQLAKLLQESGEFDQALKLYAEINDLAAATPEVKLQLAGGCSQVARRFRDKGEFEQAERFYRRAISLREPLGAETSPDVRLAHSFDFNELSFVLYQLKRMDEGERAVRTALELKHALVREFPENRAYQIHVAHSYIDLGHIAAESGQTSDAAQAYGEAANVLNKVAREPAGTRKFERFLADTLSLLGDAWLRIDRSDDAKKALQKAQDRIWMLRGEFPDNLDYQLELAHSFRKAGDLDAAQLQCAKIIGEFPKLPDGWSARGDCYVERGDFAKAIEDFSMSIKLQPDRSETWARRASCYSHQQQWDDAVSDYSQAIKIDPKVRANWHHRGIAYMELSQWEQAAADFSKVVEGWGEEPEGWYLRATANSRLNKLDFALADLRQAIAKGFVDVEKLRTDPHFDPLRSNAEFTRMLTELESRAK